eukprot:3934002-Rhodomonas_salina.1
MLVECSSWWLVRTYYQSFGEPFYEELTTDASNVVMLIMFPVMNLVRRNPLPKCSDRDPLCRTLSLVDRCRMRAVVDVPEAGLGCKRNFLVIVRADAREPAHRHHERHLHGRQAPLKTPVDAS